MRLSQKLLYLRGRGSRLLRLCLEVVMTSAVLCCGCGRSSEVLPPSVYLPSQVFLVMDTIHMQEALGAALKAELGASIRCLPQSEELFDLCPVAPMQLNMQLRRASALFFIVITGSERSSARYLEKMFKPYVSGSASEPLPRLYFLKDLYARPQAAALLLAEDSTSARRLLLKHGDRLRNYFLRLERGHILSKLEDVLNDTLSKGLHTRHSYTLGVPRSYQVAKEEESFVWLRYMDEIVDKNIVMHYTSYRDSSVFSRIPDYRDSITRTWLRDSEQTHIYMQRQTEVPMTQRVLSFHNHYAVRNCGLWKLSDHSIGGPFVSYLIADTTQARLYYLEAFLYRAGYKKRDILREMEALLWTFSTTPKPQTAQLP